LVRVEPHRDGSALADPCSASFRTTLEPSVPETLRLQRQLSDAGVAVSVVYLYIV